MDHQRAGGDALSSGGVATDAAATSPGGDKADVPPSERRSSPTAAARKSPWGMGRRDGARRSQRQGRRPRGKRRRGTGGGSEVDVWRPLFLLESNSNGHSSRTLRSRPKLSSRD
ncbi:hypothetical protein THAOC_30365 [Thalassiosira oceanica]|uniref:Uncharacterized protein n=1 Tax=Thalassiosira oceanica TaxID=159749 RepID=K0RNX1_THAOC|nr:hypothetical protein THAOC_30365 [Thalassiosira oceanica]|eukprot:EJK50601.1 hypothetical protein THAOC_30365 [Thalassiosira oceanica]